MIAVSNTTPLRYLVAIGEAVLFERLFEKVFVPASVIEELTAVKAPATVRTFAEQPPPWLEGRSVGNLAEDFPVKLHAGEREAILLFEGVRADILLIDEYAGRREALRRGLPVSGTLGLLERADALDLLPEFLETLAKLKQAGFFLGRPLEQLLIQRHLRRRASGG